MSLSVTTPDLQPITPDDDAYPVALKNCIAFGKPPTLSAIGNLDLLTHSPTALFCSV